VQRTGVAIETQGFTLVTSGRKRESLMVKFLSSFLSFCWNSFYSTCRYADSTLIRFCIQQYTWNNLWKSQAINGQIYAK